MDYNFGERPVPGDSVQSRQTASIGFWQNKRGQELIRRLHGGPLARWLAAEFPNRSGAGANTLAGRTNADVAALYTSRVQEKDGLGHPGPTKLDSQVLATPLSVYVTNQARAGVTAEADGFAVSDLGLRGQHVRRGRQPGILRGCELLHSTPER